MAMKLARTIRFDRSDLNVFPVAADEGEWALVGTFCFAALPADAITGKVKQAFSNGFLGCKSFGFSTLISVVTARPSDVAIIEDQLASHLVEKYGAPSKPATAGAVASEINFMAELCDPHPTGTLLAIQRSWGDDGIREVFRSLPKPDSCAEQKIWTVIEDDRDDDHNDNHGRDQTNPTER
jgi:hypothetical protein